MKKQLTLSVWLFLLLAGILLVAVILAELTDLSVYDSPVVLAVLAMLAVLTALSCFSKRWLSFHGIGFIACHLSVVLFLVAAFCWFAFGTTGYVQLTSGRDSYAGFSEKTGTGEPDFTLECPQFTVVYRYTCRYAYSVIEGTSYVEKGTATLNATYQNDAFTFEEKPLDCGKYGQVPLSAFYDEEGNWQTQFFHDGMLLTMVEEDSSVKQYSATLSYSDGGTDTISINHPATHNGWKIYLTSYGETFYDEHGNPHTYVTLEIKRDVANVFAIAGLILCPVGTFLLCLRPRRKREKEVEANA